MDFSLNSSLVLALAVGLWLLWVAPYLLGGRRAAAASHGVAAHPADRALNRTADRAADARPTTPPAPPRPSQGNSMNYASDRRGPAARTASVPPLRIRYGRLVAALIGASALIALPVTLVLALTGVLAWWFPAAALLLVAADVACLRALAVRDRRRRVSRAFAAAMASRPEPAAAPAAVPAPADPLPEAEPVTAASPEPYDAEQDREEPEQRLSAEQLRAAALAEAVRSGTIAARPAAAAWQPVELPKPTYVEAPKAERPAPAPLVLPEAPRPAARPGLRPTAPAPAAGSSADLPAGSPADTVQTQPATGILNLDDVLQRRRA